MTTAIIDYGSGNLRSAAKAFERAAGESGIAGAIVVTRRPEDIAAAERVVLPGVGAFADCRRGLAAVPGLEEALREAVIGRGRPFLGICVGMQLMASCGREFETVEGLGWIAGEVVAIAPSDPSLKIPHMGWNELRRRRPLFPVRGIRCSTGSNRGRTPISSTAIISVRPMPTHLLAVTDYGGRLAAVVGRDNLIGTQFHPEKSQMAGLRLIANFLRWRP